MVKRLVVGLVIGLFFGAVAAMAAIKSGMPMFQGAGETALAYVLAAATGALTGLVAGKPFWSADGKIEAGLKAFFGALLAAGGMFALQKWGMIPVNLDAIGAGHGAIGELPAASLPIIGGVLGAIFEVDNTPAANDGAGKGEAATQPSKAGRKNVRVAAMDEDDDDGAVASKRSAKR